MRYISAALPALTLATGLSLPAAAQDVHNFGVIVHDGDTSNADLFVNDDTVLDGKLCVGDTCTITETFAIETLLKLTHSATGIEFQDSSGTNVPDRDWRLLVNDAAAGGLERFSVEDLTEGTIPFTIEGGAPENAFFMTDNGDVGLGTMLPAADLHIVSGHWPEIRFEQNTSEGNGAAEFRIRASEAGLAFYTDKSISYAPFFIANASTTPFVGIYDTGVGIGTYLPSAPLHVWRADGSAQLRIEDVATATSPRTLLNLQNNGRPEIVMGNSSTGGEWSFGAGTNFVLKQGAVDSASSAKTKLFEILPSGDAVLAGSLITGGGACGGGCDRVFDASYDLPTIAEHTERMLSLGYLPNVGPTPEGRPVNVSDKLGRVLNELEHAHLYIAQQESRLTAQETQLATQGERIARLETALDALGKAD